MFDYKVLYLFVYREWSLFREYDLLLYMLVRNKTEECESEMIVQSRHYKPQSSNLQTC